MSARRLATLILILVASIACMPTAAADDGDPNHPVPCKGLSDYIPPQQLPPYVYLGPDHFAKVCIGVNIIYKDADDFAKEYVCTNPGAADPRDMAYMCSDAPHLPPPP